MRALGRGTAEDHAELSATAHTLGLALQLADALSGYPDLVAELDQGRGFVVAEAIAAGSGPACADRGATRWRP